jgi:hypothetical protein
VFVLLALVAGVIWFVAIPAMGNVQLGQHAVQRHGEIAVEARIYIQNYAGAQNRFDCPDGRTRIVVQMDHKHYAVMVVENGVEVSTFITSKHSYAIKITRGCWGGTGFAPAQ